MPSYNMEQRSAEWFSVRLGKATGSRIADVVGKTKDGKRYLAARANYMSELLCERLTGVVQTNFVSREMQWGIDNEEPARKLYMKRKGVDVKLMGFVTHPFFVDSGCSPDGLIRDDGMVQFKCPLTTTHLEYLLSNEVPEEYVPQMQWEMACTGRSWSDFVSFDPRLPDHLSMYIKPLPRDSNYINTLENEVAKFLAELQEKYLELQRFQPQQ